VESAVLLTESAARNYADTGLIDELEAVEHVRSDSFLFCSSHSGGRKRDGREEIHGSLSLGAGEALEASKGSAELRSTTVERSDDVVAFFAVELVGSVARDGRSHKTVEDKLADGVGAETDADKLVELSMDISRKMLDLEIATSVTTFAKEALADAVERSNLELLEDILTHVVGNLAERYELAVRIVDVLLVDLISNKEQFVADAELYDLALALRSQDLASRVVGIDNNNSTHMDTILDSLGMCTLELLNAKRPRISLVEVVGDLCACAEGKKCREERILGNRSHDTCLLVRADEHLKEEAHSIRSTVSAVDRLGRTLKAIAFCDEGSNITTDEGMAHRVGVDTGEEARVQKTLCTGNGIGEEGIRTLLHKLGVLAQCTHLADKGDGLLLQLLGITDVAEGNMVKGKTALDPLVLRLTQLRLIPTGTHSHFTTHFVPRIQNARRDGIDVNCRI